MLCGVCAVISNDAGENMTMKDDPEVKIFGDKLDGRIRSRLNEARLQGQLRDKLWAECDCHLFIKYYICKVRVEKSL
jgi:hypothetical protein